MYMKWKVKNGHNVVFVIGARHHLAMFNRKMLRPDCREVEAVSSQQRQ